MSSIKRDVTHIYIRVMLSTVFAVTAAVCGALSVITLYYAMGRAGQFPMQQTAGISTATLVIACVYYGWRVCEMLLAKPSYASFQMGRVLAGAIMVYTALLTGQGHLITCFHLTLWMYMPLANYTTYYTRCQPLTSQLQGIATCFRVLSLILFITVRCIWHMTMIVLFIGPILLKPSGEVYIRACFMACMSLMLVIDAAWLLKRLFKLTQLKPSNA